MVHRCAERLIFMLPSRRWTSRLQSGSSRIEGLLKNRGRTYVLSGAEGVSIYWSAVGTEPSFACRPLCLTQWLHTFFPAESSAAKIFPLQFTSFDRRRSECTSALESSGEHKDLVDQLWWCSAYFVAASTAARIIHFTKITPSSPFLSEFYISAPIICSPDIARQIFFANVMQQSWSFDPSNLVSATAERDSIFQSTQFPSKRCDEHKSCILLEIYCQEHIVLLSSFFSTQNQDLIRVHSFRDRSFEVLLEEHTVALATSLAMVQEEDIDLPAMLQNVNYHGYTRVIFEHQFDWNNLSMQSNFRLIFSCWIFFYFPASTFSSSNHPWAQVFLLDSSEQV